MDKVECQMIFFGLRIECHHDLEQAGAAEGEGTELPPLLMLLALLSAGL